MKTKSFHSLIEKRLNKEEIREIEKQAKLEVEILQYIQKLISNAITDYMEKNNIGFNELVRRLDSTPSHVAKIQKGQANLTLASMAHIFALLGEEPKEIFKARK